MKIKSYKNNPLLKGVGQKINYTEDQIKELILCKEDPVYFIKTYCKIVSLDHEEPILFDLYGFQERFINTVHTERKVISMMPRQMGKTTTTAGYLIHQVIFNGSYTVAILANKASAAREILSRMKLMYEFLPSWMQHGVKKWNEGSIELENGSKAFTAATTKSGLRGKSCNLLYVDEVSSVPNNIAEEFFTAIYPIVFAGKTTKIILTSTPIGYNHFWKYWNDSIKKINGFIPVEVIYKEHPDRDEEWANEQLKLLGSVKFQQEVMCSFIGSSNTLISGSKIAQLSAMEFLYTNDNLDITEYPKEGHDYFISVDCAEGIGGDYSTASVIDITEFPYKVVGKYRSNKISYLLFPNVLFTLAKRYSNASVLLEINSVGNEVARTLYEELEYENVLMVSSERRIGQHLSLHGQANYGVRMTKQVKRLGCHSLKTLIEEDKLLIFDKDIISEISVFIESKGTFKADEGYYDDLMMSLVVFAWAVQDDMFKDLTNKNTRKAIFEKQMDEIDQQMLPVGFYFDGSEDEEVLSDF